MKHDLKPSIFVIFGITGDLAQRKLLPALYHLFKDDLLHEHTAIVGLSRQEISVDELLSKVELCVLETDNTCDPAVMKTFHNALHMVRLNPGEASDYTKLQEKLDTIEDQHGTCMNRLFYLSIPPSVYSSTVKHLGEQGLAKGCQHGTARSALLVEKPFGYDLKSAEELIASTNQYFSEKQVYRIDHYLAKETAQNILTFRQHNPLFSDIWDSQHVTNIEVLASETINVKGRAGFYDAVGAMRDLVQSHLMQLLALTTLDVPETVTDTSLHAAKKKLLEAIEPVPRSMVASRVKRGQYRGYRDDVDNPSSNTETFVSVDLQIHSPRWQGTMVRLTTGKKLAEKKTIVRMTFRRGHDEDTENLLTFRLQPNEGIDVTLQVKKPGLADTTEPAVMNFDYAAAAHPDAYERVLIDAIRADHMLFASSDEVRATWRVLQPILDSWQTSDTDLSIYEAGSIKLD